MPLHRDIHWLGRQWAVTGHGLQLINQKQMGYYDIEVVRLWEAGLIQSMQGKAWINREDFDKALEIARARFAHAAPTDAPPIMPAVSTPPPPPPPAKPAPVELPSGPTLEELLAKLKSKAGTVAPAEKAADMPPKLETSKPEPPKPEPPKPVPAPPSTAPVDIPALSGPSGPVWPVLGYKVAGSAKFVRPWRARLTRWRGALPGLPPRA